MGDIYTVVIAIMATSIRWGCVLAVLPFVSARDFPLQARLMMALLGGVVFYPFALSFAEAAPSAATLIYGILAELIMGGALALLVVMGFSILVIAGEVISILSGLSFALLIDPSGQENQTAFTKMLNLFGLAIFIESQGLGHLLQLVGKSYQTGAVGFMLSPQRIEMLLTGFSEFLMQALFLALPFIGIFLLANFTLGFLARTVPQINQIVVGLPGSILLLLMMFIFCFSYVESEITQQHMMLFSKLTDFVAAKP